MTLYPLLIICNRFGLGGIEKTAIAFARTIDPTVFAVHLCAYDEFGVREKEASLLGLPYFTAHGNAQAVREYVDKHKIVAIHSHDQGEANTSALIQALEGSGVKCRLQSNVFSFSTPEDDQWDRQLFISTTNLLKYEYLFGLQPDFPKRAVLYNPVDFPKLDAHMLTFEERVAMRATYGLEPHHIALGKLARKTILKWSDLNIDILPPLIKKYPNIRFMVVGMPDSRFALAKRMGVAKYIIRLPETPDPKVISQYFQCMDIYVHFSKIGECCSAAIQEAMTFGIPVITNSTPFTKKHWRYVDNGQVEQVVHGETGYIASTVGSVVRAVDTLAKNASLRQVMGEAGRRRAEEWYDLTALTRSIERQTLEVLGADVPKQYAEYPLLPDEQTIRVFTQKYPELSRTGEASHSFGEAVGTAYRKHVRTHLRRVTDHLRTVRGKGEA